MKDFEDILNFTTAFTHSNNQYSIEIKNTHFQGVNQATVELVKDCQTPGNRSLSMKIHLNIGNPRIVADTLYINTQDKNAKTKKIEIASYASSDIVYEVQIHYNDDWKRVMVMYMTLSKNSQFVTDSDCEDGIQFCDALHSKLDQIVWNQLYNRIPYLMKQALFQMEL